MSQERLFTLLKAPHVTEKSNTIGENNRHITFKVAMNATKREIKQAVEKLFSVQVANVRTLVVKGKTKRTRHGLGRRINWKKAYVCLKPGHDIDFVSGAVSAAEKET
jgi:large subunit ribosomal protein L23